MSTTLVLSSKTDALRFSMHHKTRIHCQVGLERSSVLVTRVKGPCHSLYYWDEELSGCHDCSHSNSSQQCGGLHRWEESDSDNDPAIHGYLVSNYDRHQYVDLHGNKCPCHQHPDASNGIQCGELECCDKRLRLPAEFRHVRH